jgi:hypothetical protein
MFERVYFLLNWACKPEANIFNYLIKQHELIQNVLYSLMIKQKIQMQPCIGISSLNLQVGKEDVVQPFDKKII